MKLLRDIVTYVALFGLVAVSVASAIQVYHTDLIDPNEIDQTDLVEWLATHDVTSEPRETKLQLVRRLEHDFKLGVDWQAQIDTLDDQRWELFQANLSQLMQFWLMEKVDRFFELDEHERDEFLDAEIANLLAWRPVERGQTQDGSSQRQWFRIDMLHDEMQQWLQSASRDDQRRVGIFLQAVQGRMLQRALERLSSPTP